MAILKEMYLFLIFIPELQYLPGNVCNTLVHYKMLRKGRQFQWVLEFDMFDKKFRISYS